jgi:hypothetical protein
LARKQEWLERFFNGIVERGLAQLHYLHSTAATWDRVRQAISRAGAAFMKVSIGRCREEFVVFSTKPLSDTEPVDAKTALEWFAEAAKSIPLTRSEPITCSASWAPPATKKSGWHYAGDILASDEHFESTLKAQAEAGELDGRVLESGVAAYWKCQKGTTKKKREQLLSRLFGETLSLDTQKKAAATSAPAAPQPRRRASSSA